MPFAGLGLHLLVAVFLAVHALRSGQNMYWLIILFSFPLLGSIVYVLVVYLPNSRLERVRGQGRVPDLGIGLRRARTGRASATGGAARHPALEPAHARVEPVAARAAGCRLLDRPRQGLTAAAC